MANVKSVPMEAWLQAENAVIGSLLLDESLAAPILAAVDVADFGDKENRQIFQAARALLQEGKPVRIPVIDPAGDLPHAIRIGSSQPRL